MTPKTELQAMQDLDRMTSMWSMTMTNNPPRVYVTVTGPRGPITASGRSRQDAVNADLGTSGHRISFTNVRIREHREACPTS